MQIITYILLLFDFDGPEPLDTFLRLGRGMVVAGVRVHFRNPECEEGEREEFEDFGFGHCNCQRGKERVLFACGGVGGGIDSAQGTFYW